MKDQAENPEQDNAADGEVRQAKARETTAAAIVPAIFNIVAPAVRAL